MSTVPEEVSSDTPAPPKDATGIEKNIELWLDEHNVTYAREVIDLNEVDRPLSLKNQSRIGVPVLDETVNRYITALENGATFPAIVVYRKNDRHDLPFVVIDGNQRLRAYDHIGRQFVLAYVVSGATPAQVDLLTTTANRTHGVPSDPEDDLLHALSLIERTGCDATQAAGVYGVPTKKLTERLRRREVEKRLTALEVKGWHRLPMGHRSRLASVRSDPVLKQTAELMLSGALPLDESNTLISSINSKRSEADQLAVVTEKRQAKDIEIRESAGVALPPPIRKLNMGLGLILSLEPDAYEELEISDAYRDQMRGRFEEVRKHLAKLQGILK
jgi:hypothetical protein